MIEKKNGGPYTTLFVTPASPEKYDQDLIFLYQLLVREIWEGPSSGVEAATEWFGADEAYDITCLMDRLVNATDFRHKEFYYNDIPTDHFIKTAVLTALNGKYSLLRRISKFVQERITVVREG